MAIWMHHHIYGRFSTPNDELLQMGMHTNSCNTSEVYITKNNCALRLATVPEYVIQYYTGPQEPAAVQHTLPYQQVDMAVFSTQWCLKRI